MRFVLVAVLVLVAWDVVWSLFGVRPLAPWRLKAMLAAQNPPVIIDVRTPVEFEAFHIPGAVNVPVPATLAELAVHSPDPERPVVVVCMSGHRSPPVVRQMQKGGYTDVRNLTWGMTSWLLFGGTTESGQ